MEIIIRETPESASLVAARIIAKLLRGKPDAILGLATGRNRAETLGLLPLCV